MAAALALAGAPGASAVLVHLSTGRTLGYQPLRHSAAALTPLDAYFSNLDYNGGPVMPSNTNYAVFWAPAGSPAYPADYEPGIARYFEDLAHDSGGSGNVDSVATQYNDASGAVAAYESHFGGTILDTQPYPASGCKRATICLTNAQLEAELRRLVKADGLPTDRRHEYFLLTPPKVEDCFTAGGSECSAGTSAPAYCAYHGDVPLGPAGVIVFANDPYVVGNESCDEPSHHPNGSSDGALIGGLSHEHVESITDPEPNSAWTDFGGRGGEIGDKCRTFEAASEFGTPLGTAPDGSSYNQVINGDLYWYQQEWSNQTVQCLQRFTAVGEPPVASFTSTAGAGTEVSFDASGSTPAGTIARYSWQFNDGPGPSAPVESTSPTVTHTFPAGGVYTVALTVFEGNGTSSGAARTILAGTVPPPVITRVTPSRGTAAGGVSVKITGSGFTAASAVSFGGEPASYAVMSATTILASAPASVAGVVDVRVTAPGGTSVPTTADHFKYLPAVRSVTPASGPRAGGNTVTVTGAGFEPGSLGTQLRFGTVRATAVSCESQTTCTAVVPAHAAGTVDVRATVMGQTSPAEAGDRYVYE